MITVKVKFYDRETEFMVDDIKLDMPDDIVFRSANTTAVDELNAFMFDVSNEMKDYIVEHYPQLKEKFENYHADFIGRHGLGPEYD
jgi:hypothetical protein